MWVCAIRTAALYVLFWNLKRTGEKTDDARYKAHHLDVHPCGRLDVFECNYLRQLNTEVTNVTYALARPRI